MDIGLEVLFMGLLLMDARQSQYILDRPCCYRELNPMVRRYGVRRYFAVASVSHLAVSMSLPSEWVPMWQYGTIGVEGFVVGRNARLGVRVTF